VTYSQFATPDTVNVPVLWVGGTQTSPVVSLIWVARPRAS
jgi:hypothetical protein